MRSFVKDVRGDTIVEVLISIAVASAVLGGAYAVVNRTLQNSQQAQEHSEALNMAEGQLEQLKKIAETDNSVFSTSRVHCIGINDGALHQLSVHSLPQPDASAYPTACKTDTATGPGYRVAFQFDDKATASPYDDEFTVHVDWPSVTGNGDDHVTLLYRVHP